MSESVKINLTGSQWELYTCTMKCESAAARMNEVATEAINKGIRKINAGGSVDEARADAWKAFNKVATDLSKYGAADREPSLHFEKFIEKYLTSVPG
jgi:hypothetical protein